MSNADRIRDYYASFDEWRRLDTPAGRLEYQRTLQLIESHITKDAHVLDLGGGPGRYTVHLAKSGRTVELVDLSPELVEQARARVQEADVSGRVKSLSVACATSLETHQDGAFDAVLCLGPFYHLTEAQARTKACREIFRVLKPGGKALVGFIPHLSGLTALVDRASTSCGQVTVQNFRDTAQDGSFHNNSAQGFQCGHYIGSDALDSLFEENGFRQELVTSIRGLGYGREHALEKLALDSPELHGAISQTLVETSDRPEIVALCGHALYIATKLKQLEIEREPSPG